MNKIRSCKPEIKCGEILKKSAKVKLEKGWIEEQRIYVFTSDNKCNFRGFAYLGNKNTSVRKIINLKKPSKYNPGPNIYYQVRGVMCEGDPDVRISRSFTIGSYGSVITDLVKSITSDAWEKYSVPEKDALPSYVWTKDGKKARGESPIYHPKDTYISSNAPARMSFFKNIKIPKYEILGNGNLKIEHGDGANIIIDKTSGNIVNSNIYDPIMFNKSTCGSRISFAKGRARLKLKVKYKKDAKRKYISYTMNPTGGASDDRKTKKDFKKDDTFKFKFSLIENI